MPVWATIQEKALTPAAANSLPDVSHIHTQFLPDFTAAGVLKDLNPVAARDNGAKLDDFFPGVLGFFQSKSTTRGFPFFSGPATMLYNKAVYRQLGVKEPNEYEKAGAWNWQTFVDVARQLTRGEGTAKTWG